jgi:hypothetical protein
VTGGFKGFDLAIFTPGRRIRMNGSDQPMPNWASLSPGGRTQCWPSPRLRPGRGTLSERANWAAGKHVCAEVFGPNFEKFRFFPFLEDINDSLFDEFELILI